MLAGGTFASVRAADSSLIRNGSFEDGNLWKDWFVFSAGTSRDEFVKIVDLSEGGGSGVAITGPQEKYLCQDVKMKEGESGPHILRWKAKGTGGGRVGIMTWDLDRNISNLGFLKFWATNDFELHEIRLTIPEDAVIARITLAGQSEDSIVVFDKVELVPIADSK